MEPGLEGRCGDAEQKQGGSVADGVGDLGHVGECGEWREEQLDTKGPLFLRFL